MMNHYADCAVNHGGSKCDMECRSMQILDLAEKAKARAEAATPPPWRESHSHVASFDPERCAFWRRVVEEDVDRDIAKYGEPRSIGGRTREEEIEHRVAWYGGGDLICESIGPADRTFVAAAREDVPALADAVIRLADENEYLRKQVEFAERALARVEVGGRRHITVAPTDDPLQNRARLQAALDRARDGDTVEVVGDFYIAGGAETKRDTAQARIAKLEGLLRDARAFVAFGALPAGEYDTQHPREARIHDSDRTDGDPNGPWGRHCRSILAAIDAALKEGT